MRTNPRKPLRKRYAMARHSLGIAQTPKSFKLLLLAALAASIEGRCPAFLQSRREGAHLPLLWLDLNEWVDFHFFSEAIQEGWIQALHYYYGRQPAAELIWQHWTRMDEEWRLRKPVAYPTFDQWQEHVAALHLNYARKSLRRRLFVGAA